MTWWRGLPQRQQRAGHAVLRSGDAHYRPGRRLYAVRRHAAGVTLYRDCPRGREKPRGLGAVSLDLTHARSQLADDSRHEGQSLRFLYAKSLNGFGTNFQLLGYRYSTKGFYTLDDVAWRSMEGYQYGEGQDDDGVPDVQSYHNLTWNKKGRFQLNISQSLGDYGSVYLSGSQQSYWGTSESNVWYQLGYAGGVKGINYSVSWSWNKAVGIDGTDRIASFNVSVPFSLFTRNGYRRDSAIDRAYATASASRNRDGDTSWQTGVSGTLLEDRNLNYSVTQGHASNNGASGSASANWQATYGTLGVGYNYARDQHDLNWQLSGGVVGHSDGVTFSQPLGDTNVLIKAPGASGVSIENQTGVKTDWRGYAVMPYATVYRYNRVALDTNTMSNNTDIENNVSSVVPTKGALVRASFDTRIGVRALLTVTLGDQPVPFGAVVRETQSGVTSMVGDDGQIYLSGLPLEGELLIQWGDGKQSQCRASYHLPPESLNQAITLAGHAVNANRNLIMTIIRSIFGAAVLCSALPTWATVCQNSTGVAKDISYDLSNVFNSSNNRPGDCHPGAKIWTGGGECYLSPWDNR